MQLFALQSQWITMESQWIATELHHHNAVAIYHNENVIMTVKIESKSNRSQFVSIRFRQKLPCFHFIIQLVFFFKKNCMEKYEFPKKEFFFGSILVTEATKMIARFLWFFSFLNFLDLKHEKNHVFFKNCKFDKLCQKHEKFYRNGTYLVLFCLFDFSANYYINFMQIWKICVFSKKFFFVVSNSKYLFLAMLNIEIWKY